MPKHLYLPELFADANVPEPPHAAHWSASERRLVGSVADGIAVDEQATIRGVSSVPDVWARPLLFQSALKPKSNHPLRSQMVREWRGLLSLLALRKVHNFPVEIVPVPFDEGVFARALQTLSPAPVQLEPDRRYAWTDVLMIRYDGIPVGAFSPATLVYTATGYQERLKERQVSLRDARGYLQPPTDRDDLAAVAEWVYVQMQRLDELLDTREENPDDVVVLGLRELFDEWLADLRLQLGLGERDEMDAGEVKVADDHHDYAPPGWSPMERYRVYQTLLRPLVHDEGGERGGDVWSKSSLFLGITRNRSEHAGLVVIHERLLTQEAKVWGFKRLSSLGGDAASALRNFDDAHGYGEVIAGERLRPYNVVWIRPERFFLTDTLLRAKDRRFALAEKERATNGGGRYVLPFRARLFDYFGPEDVVEKLRPEFTELEGGNVRFSFYLPLRDEGEVKVDKTYRTKNPGAGEGSIREEPLPVLDLFPDYLPGWRRYYLFHSDAERFSAAPVIADGVAHPPSERAVDQPDGTRQKAIVIETSGEDAFPEAVALAVQEGNRTTQVGTVLVRRRLDDLGGLRDRWTVGVDFGTSNTNVYIQREGDPAAALRVDFPRHLRPLTDVGEAYRDAQLQTFFVPNREETFPTPTFLDLLSARPNEGRLLLDYFIHFPDTPWWPGRVRHDLKWDAPGDRVTTYFLESVLFLVLLKAVDQRVQSLDFRFSYPKTFSDGELAVYTGEWRTAFAALYENEVTAVLSPGRARVQASTPRMKSEGKATGEFFTNRNTIQNENDRATKSRSICLDVGGGTTDISLWFDDNIVYDTSIRFAGKQIASYLSRYPSLREILLTPDAIRALDGAGSNEELFGARLNYVLRREDRDLAARLNRGSNRPELVRLRQLIAFEFGAITFYTAALVGAADRSGVARGLLAKVAEGGIGLHWGGNAAKLITWIDFGERQRYGLAEKMLNGLFYMALKDIGTEAYQPNLGQVQSPRHKSEAAGGLVVLGDDQFETASTRPVGFDLYDVEPGGGAAAGELVGMVAGEDLVVDGREVKGLDTLTEKDLFKDGRCLVERVSADRLARFVELFNIFGDRFGLFSRGMAISLDEARKRQIQEKAVDFFVGQKGRKEGTRVIEPVFIVEAKILMELIKSAP